MRSSLRNSKNNPINQNHTIIYERRYISTSEHTGWGLLAIMGCMQRIGGSVVDNYVLYLT